MAVKIPLHLFTYQRKIANVYKAYLRRLEGIYCDRLKYRYEATLLRAEFNQIYYENDVRISKVMLQDKEKEMAKIYYPPIVFPTSPNGPDYRRYTLYEDFFLDLWHPHEKAVYPDYFKRRELRKQQYLEMWNRKHAPPKPDPAQ